MKAVRRFAAAGGPVLGICNGFQILLEAGLLPGRDDAQPRLKFVCRHVHLRVETATRRSPALRARARCCAFPIAHREGNYFCRRGRRSTDWSGTARSSSATATPTAELTAAANPNGSLDNIAGICNRERNVLGMMPHPERAAEELLTSADGKIVFESLMGAWQLRIADCGLKAADFGHRISFPSSMGEVRDPMPDVRMRIEILFVCFVYFVVNFPEGSKHD